MRFFAGPKEIDYAAFEQMLPEEAKLLKPVLDYDAAFEVNEDKALFLRSEFSAPISLALQKELERHRKQFFKNSIYEQPLARALGIKRRRGKPRVLDASAGTLKDCMLMVSMGVEALACERHPIAQALIVNALSFFRPEGLEFFPMDARELVGLRSDFDVVYFDPMYAQKNERAAPRKEMRIFRELIHHDEDASDNANFFLSLGKRLVIKRSSKASPLLPDPMASYGKKSTVYDVYCSYGPS